MELQELLSLMIERDAFVLYITAGRSPVFRVDGALQPVSDYVLKAEEVEAFATSLMNNNQQAEFKEKKVINLVTCLFGVSRFRLHIFRQRGSVVIVTQRVRTEIPSLDGLSLPTVFKDLSLSKQGLILIVGGAGSGRSTTVAAMIEHRNENASGHIVCIEDPIEFTHQHKNCLVTQRELGADTGTFDQALSDALQEAPDAVAIGAIRDARTIEAAIGIAETGRLCIGTLLAGSSAQALESALSLFPAARHPEILLRLAVTLKAIVAQRLLTISDGRRMAAVEILFACGPIKSLIEKGDFDAIPDAIEKNGQQGCQTFDQ